MRVTFTYTQEDLVDASTRFLARSKTIRKWRLMELGWSLVLTWGIVFLIFRNAFLKAVLAASTAALIAVLFTRLFQPVIIQRRLRKFVREKHGNEDTFPCDVELTPAAILIQDCATQTTLKWQTVEEISVNSDSVAIFARPGGVIVRDRAFASPDEKRHFVELAQSYLTAARPK
jgi:hypothetical protein